MRWLKCRRCGDNFQQLPGRVSGWCEECAAEATVGLLVIDPPDLDLPETEDREDQ